MLFQNYYNKQKKKKTTLEFVIKIIYEINTKFTVIHVQLDDEEIWPLIKLNNLF